MAGFMDLAASTPFTVQEIVEGGVALEAFGANAEALLPTLANVAAFMGKGYLMLPLHLVEHLPGVRCCRCI